MNASPTLPFNTFVWIFFIGFFNSVYGDVIFWKKEVKPLLEQNCWKCHGADKVRAGLVLTTREGILKGGEVGPAVNLEDPSSSLLLQMVSYKDDHYQMPPIGKLPQEKIDVLAKWIEMGLPFAKEDEIEPDFVSALKLCKRRRIGPLRPEANRELFYKKDMGILARGGFSFELSKRVLDLEKDEFDKLIKII